MEKENDIKAKKTDTLSTETKEMDKKELSITDLEEFLDKLPSDNQRIRLLKRLFVIKTGLGKRHQENRDS